MFPLNKLIGLTFNILYIFAEVTFKTLAEPIKIGRLYECAHGLKGEVYALNDRQLLITGFNYNGGPDASFHGQLRGSKAIYTTDVDQYITLSYPNDRCGRLKAITNNANITLTLPTSIRDFETIGVFCYAYCHNFGHVHIPKDLKVGEAPFTVQIFNECPKKDNNNDCGIGRHPDNVLYPNCRGGNGMTVSTTTSSTEKNVIDTGTSSTEDSSEIVMTTTNGATGTKIGFTVIMMVVFVNAIINLF